MDNKPNLKHYPYAWLDEVVEITLNPEKTDLTKLETQQLEAIENRFNNELQKVLSDLKSHTFCLFSSKKIKTIVKTYYDSLLFLEKQAMKNLAAYPNDHQLSVTGEQLILNMQTMSFTFLKRYGKYLDEDTSSTSQQKTVLPIVPKILCKMSVDQIGIVLRAADDSKVIQASSLSIIFRSIVPYLSTDKIKQISWNSMRKSTYQIEQIDKEVAIAILEKLILKIKDY